MLLLEQDSTREEQVNKLLGPEPKLDAGKEKEYEIEAIRDTAVYANNAAGGQIPWLYYLVSWKKYLKNESIWETTSALMHLWKMINSYYKDHPEKSPAMFSPIDSALPMAKPIIKPLT